MKNDVTEGQKLPRYGIGQMIPGGFGHRGADLYAV